MPHVVTQSCCSDGSCVYACPVNCIHPSPDEPGFATAEMLYIDPVACVDCGACVSACPVGAIAPDTRLEPEQLPFVALNAAYYPDRPEGEKLPPTSKLAPVIEAPKVLPQGANPLTVAIVGSGPAAMYAADELLTQRGVRVNVFERLPTPYGLVRAGVAPDHQSTKRVTRLFDKIAKRRSFRFFLNVEVGSDLSHAELLAHHHAVLYAVGAPNDRRLDIDGMGLPGTGTATEIVAWINGHPEYTDLPVDLSARAGGDHRQRQRRARCRTDPDNRSRCVGAHGHLRPCAGRAAGSKVTEVVIAARRGPAQSAFTLPELIGLTSTCEVVLDAGRPRPGAGRPGRREDRADAQQAGDPEQARRRVDARDAAQDPARLPPHAAARSRRRPRERCRVHGHRQRRDPPARRRSGADLNRLPRQADSRSAVRRHRRGGAQRRRQGDRPAERETGARQLRRRLDQARTDRLHRHEQVMRTADCARTWSPTTTKVSWPTRGHPAALDKLVRSRRPMWSTQRAGRRSTRPKSHAVGGTAARQVHLRRRHAGRRCGRTAALAPAAGACRPSALIFAAASAV